MKHILKEAMSYCLPSIVVNRQDKMGFPVPLVHWMKDEAKDFVYDIFSSRTALNRDLIDNRKVLQELAKEWQFGRKSWGLLCLELWQQEFHDQTQSFTDFDKSL